MFRQFFKPLLILMALAAVAPVTAMAGTLEITGPSGASLVINDQDMGFFPLDGPLDLPGGVYTIKSQMVGHQDYENTIKLVGDGAWQRVAVRLVPFSRKTAWTSNIFFAGLGQHYLGKSTRGWIYNIAEAGGLLVALVSELDRNNLAKDVAELEDLYNSSINADDITRYREEADQAYSDMKDAEEMRDTGLMVAVGAIAVSILDAIIFFPSVEAGVGPVPMDTGSLDFGPWNDPNPLSTVHAAVRLEF